MYIAQEFCNKVQKQSTYYHITTKYQSMKKIIVTLGVLAGLFFGQVQAQTDTSGRQEVYRQTHTKSTELKHTKLKVGFDYQKEQMNGEEWLTASPYFYPSDSLVLDAKAMLIHQVALDKNGQKKDLKYDYQNNQLTIHLDKIYQKGETYTVYINYTARPNEVKQKGSAAISDAKGLYFINPRGEEEGKPTQIWTQGETESSSAWFPTIDKPNQKTTQEIMMTVPEKYVTLSNGKLISQKKAGNGLRTDHWKMDKKHAPYLFFMGVGEYSVVKDKWKNIDVDYYVEKEYEPYAREIFGDTPEMLEFFSKKLNYPYPWNKYAQITGRDYVSGAMENTTAVLHGESAQQKHEDLVDENTWEHVIAHELFHHWFGDLVTTESWSNLTVNESFANYSEYLWAEHKHGKEAADYHLIHDRLGYMMNPMNVSKDLVRFNYHKREDMFDGVSYNKGGSILHMLRNYLGDDAFFAGISDYLKTNEYGTGEAHQLRLSLEKISGKDLNWFFNQWYFGSGHPKLTYTTTYNPVKKETTLSIKQSQKPLFQFPLTVDVFVKGKRQRQKVWVNAQETDDVILKADAEPDFVNINADGILLTSIHEEKTPAQYLVQYQQTPEFYSRYKAIENAKKSTDKAALQTLVAGLDDKNFRLAISAINGIDLSQPEHQKLALKKIEKLAKNHTKTLVKAAAISALVKTNNKKYLPIFENGMNATSNAIKGASLLGISKLNPSALATYMDKVDLNNVNEDTMKALLPVIVDHKIEKHLPAIAEMVVFYPFIKFQDAEMGVNAEKGFNWLMNTDNLEATSKAVGILKQVKGQLGENPQAKMMMSQVIQKGLDAKMKLLKANPKSQSLNEQVKILNDVLKTYK